MIGALASFALASTVILLAGVRLARYGDAIARRTGLGGTWMGLVAMATVLGLVPPFVGPLIYMLFRPPEYLEDVRERELEMLAIEERLAEHDLRCPVCRGPVEASYLVCPVCTTRLKQACTECAAPLEPIWQVCPYCATPVPPALVTGDDVLQPVRPRRQRRSG